MRPRAGAPVESETPKQADFHICAQGQSFFCLKSDSQAGWAVRVPQAPSPACQGKGRGAKARKQKLELPLDVKALAVSKRCWHGKAGNGC